MIDPRKLREKFIELFGSQPRLFRAPGRVNLIGEHTDYNDGFVLPMAIDREAAVAIATRNVRKVRVHTVNFDETAEFDLDIETARKQGFWLNYIEGVARLLERHGATLVGSDIVLWSDVPGGAGLSSSAALEVAVGLSLSEISAADVDRVTIAKIGQQTEHEFIGAKVGIMDQFVSANARSGHALLLDCRSLEFEYVPLDTTEVAIVICDTNVKHDLATSAYNTRRAECEQAVEILKESLPEIVKLRDVTVADFEKYAENLPEVVRRRARHVVTENERVIYGADALKENDFAAFGALMWKSHESLRYDYEVSSKELDTMVEIAKQCEGVLGARMTGGGFGGSTVNLVKREHCNTFQDKIRSTYKQATGIDPTILISEAAEGASEIVID